jgi:hypothetical protein
MQEPSGNGLIRPRGPSLRVAALRVATLRVATLRVSGESTRRYIALLSACAAVAHGAVINPHLQEWPAAGVFFIVVTIAQAFIGLCFARSERQATPRLIISALIINVGVVLVYVVSRTIPIPFAPKVGAHGSVNVPGVPIIPSRVESLGSLDVVVFFVELLTIALLVSIARGSTRRLLGNVLLASGAALLVAGATGTL